MGAACTVLEGNEEGKEGVKYFVIPDSKGPKAIGMKEAVGDSLPNNKKFGKNGESKLISDDGTGRRGLSCSVSGRNTDVICSINADVSGTTACSTITSDMLSINTANSAGSSIHKTEINNLSNEVLSAASSDDNVCEDKKAREGGKVQEIAEATADVETAATEATGQSTKSKNAKRTTSILERILKTGIMKQKNHLKMCDIRKTGSCTCRVKERHLMIGQESSESFEKKNKELCEKNDDAVMAQKSVIMEGNPTIADRARTIKQIRELVGPNSVEIKRKRQEEEEAKKKAIENAKMKETEDDKKRVQEEILKKKSKQAKENKDKKNERSKENLAVIDDNVDEDQNKKIIKVDDQENMVEIVKKRNKSLSAMFGNKNADKSIMKTPLKNDKPRTGDKVKGIEKAKTGDEKIKTKGSKSKKAEKIKSRKNSKSKSSKKKAEKIVRRTGYTKPADRPEAGYYQEKDKDVIEIRLNDDDNKALENQSDELIKISQDSATEGKSSSPSTSSRRLKMVHKIKIMIKLRRNMLANSKAYCAIPASPKESKDNSED